jgi:type II secretory pathway component PulF
MTWFSFKGKDTQGIIVRGQYNAPSKIELAAHLKQMGVIPTAVKQLSVVSVFFLRCKRAISCCLPIGSVTLSVFYYQLAALIDAGISVKNALSLMACHMTHPRFSLLIDDLVLKLNAGKTLCDAMKKYTRVFSGPTIRLISLSRSQEELSAVFTYSDHLLRRFSFVRKLLHVFVPQFSLTIVFFAILLFLRFQFLADFQYAIYVFNNPEPATIHFFTFVTGLFSVHVLAFLLGLVSFFLVLWFLFKFSARVAYCFDALFLFFPVISGFIVARERERLSLMFSIFLRGGATTQKCVKCASLVSLNRVFRQRLEGVLEAISQGESLLTALTRFRIFSSAEAQLVSLGMTANSLPKAFERIHQISEMVLERKFLLLTEGARVAMYLLNVSLFIFTAVVFQLLLFYPGVK